MAAFALPLKLNILVGIAAAVAVGLVMEAAWPEGQPRGQTPDADGGESRL